MSEDGGLAVAETPAEDIEDLYENAPCGYVSTTLDGRIVRVNATMAGWAGLTPDHLVGERFRDLLTVGTRILYEAHFAPLLNMQGFFDEGSFDLRAADEETIPVFVSGKVRKSSDGKPLLIRLTLLKADERRRYERQLLDARHTSQNSERMTQGLLQTERETSELREQFIAVLGHDLRNPLMSISAATGLLQKDQSAEKRKFLFEMLAGSVVRMSGLIDNVLDFARGRLGAGIPLDFRPEVILPPVLEQVVAELRLGVPDRIIETDFEMPVPIKCDPSRIGQLVSNLLGNALTHGAADKPVRIHADETDDVLTIWVSNGGDPIPDKVMERLFQPFFRGEVRASLQGLGLGLHIASEIAKAHGGVLSVASTAEETRFTFQMPISDR